MSRPVIGICATIERARWTYWDEEAALISMNYVRQVQRAGGIAVVLPPDREPAELLAVLDGVLLTGGADVGDVPERDAFELALARRALDRVPVGAADEAARLCEITGTMRLGLDDDTLTRAAEIASRRTELDGTPPRADTSELLELYHAAN